MHHYTIQNKALYLAEHAAVNHHFLVPIYDSEERMKRRVLLVRAIKLQTKHLSLDSRV